MDLRIWYQVIVPLMEVIGTATICITTPQSRYNFFSEMLLLRDERNKLVFNSVRVGM